jgi:hypothetical protein
MMWLKVNVFHVWEIAKWVEQLLIFLNTSVLYGSVCLHPAPELLLRHCSPLHAFLCG